MGCTLFQKHQNAELKFLKLQTIAENTKSASQLLLGVLERKLPQNGKKQMSKHTKNIEKFKKKGYAQKTGKKILSLQLPKV